VALVFSLMLVLLVFVSFCDGGRLQLRQTDCLFVEPVSSAVQFQLGVAESFSDIVCEPFLLELAVLCNVSFASVSLTRIVSDGEVDVEKVTILGIQCTDVATCPHAVDALFALMSQHKIRDQLRYRVVFGIDPSGITVYNYYQALFNVFQTIAPSTFLYSAPSATSNVFGEAGAAVYLAGFKEVNGFLNVALMGNGSCPVDTSTCLFANSSLLKFIGGPNVGYCARCPASWQNTSCSC
jgi:hypothetical protein